MEVHLASSGEDRRKLYELRYQIQVEEIGLEPYGTFHKLKAVRDDFDVDAEHIYVTDGSEVIAYMRLFFCNEIQIPDLLRDAYQLSKFAEFGEDRLAIFDHYFVAKEYRDSIAPQLLFEEAYRLIASRNILFFFSYSNPDIRGLFEKIGYRRYTGNFVEPGSGLQTPVVFVVNDIDYLRRINAALLSVAENTVQQDESGSWLESNFDRSGFLDPKPLQDPTAFWPHLTKQLHLPPLIGLPIFADMTVPDAFRFIKNSLIVHLDVEEFLIHQGDLGNEMYVVLSGEVDVMSKGMKIATLGPGSVLGEVSFLSATPRSADVVVTKAGEFLILNQNTFRKIMSSMPEVASKVLFNLSLILCERVQNATSKWIDGVNNQASE